MHDGQGQLLRHDKSRQHHQRNLRDEPAQKAQRHDLAQVRRQHQTSKEQVHHAQGQLPRRHAHHLVCTHALRQLHDRHTGERERTKSRRRRSSAHTQAQKHRTWRPMNCVPPMTRYSLPTRHRAALGPRVMLGIALAPPPAAALAWSRARGGLLRASPRGRAKESARAPLLVCPGHHDQAAAGHRE
jgi:hypothetical protein